MAQCAHCKTETYLYDGGVPICIKCSDLWEAQRKPPGTEKQIRAALKDELAAATEQAVQASEAFLKVTAEIPSGLPHPDGTQRIHNASHEMSQARERMLLAHKRLNDYVERGIGPEGLKRTG
jgi:hypothetical protein